MITSTATVIREVVCGLNISLNKYLVYVNPSSFHAREAASLISSAKTERSKESDFIITRCVVHYPVRRYHGKESRYAFTRERGKWIRDLS